MKVIPTFAEFSRILAATHDMREVEVIVIDPCKSGIEKHTVPTVGQFDGDMYSMRPSEDVFAALVDNDKGDVSTLCWNTWSKNGFKYFLLEGAKSKEQILELPGFVFSVTSDSGRTTELYNQGVAVLLKLEGLIWKDADILVARSFSGKEMQDVADNVKFDI